MNKFFKTVLTAIFVVISKVGYFFLWPFRFVRDNFSSFVTQIIGLSKSVYSVFSIPKVFFNPSIKNKKITKTKPIRVKNIFQNIFSKKITLFLLGFFAALLFVFVPFELYRWYKDLPNPNLLSEIVNKSTKILDRKGRLMYEIYVDKDYDPVPLDKIPEYVKQATIAVEDDSFYTHNGIRPISIARAIQKSLTSDELQGGSTITQQLVKNVLLSPERTISRKLKEIVVSIFVERRYSKDQILEMYLNNISYGGTAWGIQSASNKFFGKDVTNLTLAESAFLAGLPSSPSVYSPFSGSANRAKERQGFVLQRMAELGYITYDEANTAYASDLVFVSQQEFIRAPHFVNYVRTLLNEKYGSRLVDTGGLTVVTALDLDVQDQVQSIVTDEVKKGANLKFTNGAAIVIDSKSSEILSYVGSTDFFSSSIDGEVDLITSFRQPGSSIKPLTYSLAIKNGYTAASLIEDSKTTFNIKGSPPYTPVNYDGKYHGKVTIREALSNSYNIPAVKLANRLGPDSIVRLGKDLGLFGWDVDGSYGISVTLGGKEVRLLDLANMYATFARKGVYRDTIPILSVTDANGYEIYQTDFSSKRVLDEGVAYIITNILSDNNARTRAFGRNSTLEIPNHSVAVKTGTTDLKRDNWTLGYTPSYVVGVWVGNNDNEPMHPSLSSGLSGASPIWNRIMNYLLKDTQNEAFEMPPSVFEKKDEKCDNKAEVFIKGTAPAHLCDLSDDKDN